MIGSFQWITCDQSPVFLLSAHSLNMFVHKISHRFRTSVYAIFVILSFSFLQPKLLYVLPVQTGTADMYKAATTEDLIPVK